MVLILIVLEDGLGELGAVHYVVRTGSLNPYCLGGWSRRAIQNPLNDKESMS